MNKINKINELKMKNLRPAVKECETMEHSVKKIVNEICRRAEREVPEYGDFAPVYEELKNKNPEIVATDFMLRIVKPLKNIEGHEKIRNVELVAYRLPSPYKVSGIIATGTKEEVLNQLKAPEFYTKVEESFKNLSKNLEDIG